jgi:hypothetical protein
LGPVIYLGDFSGKTLLPLAGGADREDVEGSMAGRAFSAGQPVATARGDAVLVTEQASRTGVLAVTVPHGTPEFLEQVELLGVFAGLAVAAIALVSDAPYVRRRPYREGYSGDIRYIALSARSMIAKA